MQRIVIKMTEKKECCLARDVLWYLVFIGFAVNYMIRINLNIAIVSMVKVQPKDNISLTSECLKEDNFSGNHFLIWDNSTELKSLENKTEINLVKKPSQTFSWNEKEQSNILGAFFWLHWTTQIPGGLLASRYGTKLVFGLANFTGVLCCFAIPLAAFMGHYHLILVRAFQGILCGFAWPAMHNMTARWIPPNERSKFVTAYLGSSVGAALTYPLCGFIIDKWGWELSFYVCGIMGSLWYAMWWLLVYDNPAEHPRISEQEKQYIIASLGQSYSKNKAPVPWKDILTSIPVWMNILAQWGGMWGLFTLTTHTPTYFKFIHGWNIKATGILVGLPHLTRTLWAYIFSMFGDYLLRSKKLGKTNVRKIATAICTIGQSIFMLALSFSGCDSTKAVIFMTAAVGIHGAVSTGPLASVVDISPNYASIILGIVNTMVAMAGFLTPVLVGYLTFQNQTVQQWQKIYWVASFMLFTTGVVYIIFAQAELQPWNSPKKNETELKYMKSKQDKASIQYQKVNTNQNRFSFKT